MVPLTVFIPFLMIPIAAVMFALFFVFWIIMIVDVATRKFKEGNDKIVWILVVILASWIGALIYYFVVYMKHKSMKWFWITLLILFVILLALAVSFIVGLSMASI